MKIFLKIAIRILPVIAVFTLLYIGYLHFWGDRSQNTWFGRRHSLADIKVESAKAYKFFESYYDSILLMSPEQQSRIGIKETQDKWDDVSEKAMDRRIEFYKKSLAYLMDSLRLDRLDSVNQVSYLLLEDYLKTAIEGDKYRHYNYPVSQIYGLHTQTVSFLLDVHTIESKADAIAYIARLKGITSKFGDLIDGLKAREDKAVMLPRFLYPQILEVCNNIISGHPYGLLPLKKNVLYDDFETKVANLSTLQTAQKKQLLDSCKQALLLYVGPAYRDLIAVLKAQEKKASDNAGYWKMLGGDEYYIFKLKQLTTTQLTPDEIYDLGNEEIQRIQKEMEALQQKIGFKGTLKDFFAFIRESKQFYYPNTPQGRAAYIAQTTEIIDSMRRRLPELLHSLPSVRLSVKAVETYCEKAAVKVFYYQPFLTETNRIGIYYINTLDMTMLPKYQMEALAYQKGIPGHHIQSAMAQEMEKLPRFRRYAQNYAAYIYGWELYAGQIPKEMGFYRDPYSDFGRLAIELWRACGLVVDVGIHNKRWTREQAIQFYQSNSPNSISDCIKTVEQHLVAPAETIAYKVGMISMLELRKKAKDALGDKFDIRDFHDIILKNGAVPLTILEDLVDAFIKKTKNKK